MARTSSPRPYRFRRTGRRPSVARRPSRSRPLPPAVRPRPGEWLIVVVLVLVALSGALDYLGSHPLVLALLLTAIALAGILSATLWGRRCYRGWRREGHGALPPDLGSWLALSPAGFERAVARLCQRDGCTQVTVLGGANDRAGDIKARTPDGRWLLLQCKRYKPGNHVGAPTLYQVKGTHRHTHRCEVAAVVTTSTFTASAVDWNSDLPPEERLRLVGARQLLAWADGTGPTPWRPAREGPHHVSKKPFLT